MGKTKWKRFLSVLLLISMVIQQTNVVTVASGATFTSGDNRKESAGSLFTSDASKVADAPLVEEGAAAVRKNADAP